MSQDIRPNESARPAIRVHVERDSVCMGDDMDCPHAHDFTLPHDATLRDLFRHLAEENYLPGVAGKNHSWSAMIGDDEVAKVSANDQFPRPSHSLDERASLHAPGGSVKVVFVYHSARD